MKHPDKKHPYLLSDGTLVIPFDSDPKYHWWKGGQSVKQTRTDLEAEKHTTNNENTSKHLDHNSGIHFGQAV